jgi:hypothetical protein
METFCSLVCDKRAFKHFVNTTKAYGYKDLIQSIALQSKELCNVIYKALIHNFEILIDQAWLVTTHYIKMEAECKNTNSN